MKKQLLKPVFVWNYDTIKDYSTYQDLDNRLTGFLLANDNVERTVIYKGSQKDAVDRYLAATEKLQKELAEAKNSEEVKLSKPVAAYVGNQEDGYTRLDDNGVSKEKYRRLEDGTYEEIKEIN